MPLPTARLGQLLSRAALAQVPAAAPDTPYNGDFLQLSNNGAVEGRGRAQAGPVLLWLSQIPVSSVQTVLAAQHWFMAVSQGWQSLTC